MPTPADQLPGGVTGLAQRIATLERALRELRAARRLEAATIGKGALTVQATPGGPSIALTATGPIPFSGDTYPPAVVISSGDSAELTPGVLTGHVADGELGPVPVVLITCPDLAYGLAYLELAGGGPAGDSPTVALAAGDSNLALGATELTCYLAGPGVGITMDSAGARLSTETWTTLPLDNGWTAYGSPYQSPIYRRQIDGTVQLSGLIAAGTTTVGTTVATLPIGYRPASDHVFKTSAGAATAVADVYVRSSGAITIQNVAGTVTWLSLSGVRFPA